MLQFCKENGLSRTFETLRDETQVTLNSVDSVESFVADVQEGRWDAVLAAVTTLQIPQPKLMDLYEQVKNVSASSSQQRRRASLLLFAAFCLVWLTLLLPLDCD